MPDIIQWDQSAASRIDMDFAIRQAEQLVTRCRTRYIVPVPRTAAGQGPASEAQVREAMTAGGIIQARQDQYIAAWNLLKLQGLNAGPLAPPTGRRPTYAQMRAALSAAGLPIPLTNAETARAYQQLTGQSQVPPLPEIPAPPQRPENEILGELQTVATDETEYPPFGGGRQ